jgi:putative tryptophan/tyrosine transport system substrate-binding protein
MRRRDLVKIIASSAALWPLAARSQQPERVRRIGVLQPFAKDAPESARVEAFVQELQRLGWTDGRNLQIEYRWETHDLQKAAMELVALSPDVILVGTTPALSSLHQVTRTVPIVFAQVADPVGAGFVASLAKPGGNITGFTVFDYEMGAKWLGLLKEIAPNVTRVGVIREPTSTSSIGQFGAAQSAARLFKVEVSPLGGQDNKDIERTVTEFARESNCGLISVASPLVINNRKLIISLAARHQLPAVYPFPPYAADGGLICYGPDAIDPHRKAAGYVDRILKGEKPADLPVQAATKFELVINLRTAKSLGLAVPPTLLDRADKVIE